MPSVTDQLGTRIELPQPAQRIVSVVPGQTELLFDLGLEKEVIGITKFCIHPQQWFKTKTRVGGTKNLAIDKIKSLNPDLVIANKEENTQADIEQIREFTQVYVSDVNTLAGAFEMFRDIGKLTGTEHLSEVLVTQIEQSFLRLSKKNGGTKKRVLYLIWRQPYMAAGSDTFISEMLTIAGYENAIQQLRYPEIPVQSIKDINPDYIFLSSEPYPFKEKHIEELGNYFSKEEIHLVDGEIFSWYGSRLLKAADYFEELHEKTS